MEYSIKSGLKKKELRKEKRREEKRREEKRGDEEKRRWKIKIEENISKAEDENG